MDLAKEVMKELKTIKLHGATITQIECLTDETHVMLQVKEVKISFVIRSLIDYTLTSVSRGEVQIEGHHEELQQWRDWVRDVVGIVQPIVDKKRLELIEEAPSANQVREPLGEMVKTDKSVITLNNVDTIVEEVEVKMTGTIPLIEQQYQRLRDVYEQTNAEIKAWENELEAKEEKIPQALIEMRSYALDLEQDLKVKMNVISQREQKKALHDVIEEKYHHLLNICKKAEKDMQSLKDNLQDREKIVPKELDYALAFMQDVVEETKEQLRLEPIKEEGKNKFLRFLGNVLFYAMLIIFVLGVALFGGNEGEPRHLFGYSFMIVLSPSMQSDIPQGAMIITEPVDPNHIQIGNDITFLQDGSVRSVTHRVIDIYENYAGTNQRGFRTQGIENSDPDAEIVAAPNVVGRVIFVNLILGQLIGFVQENIVIIILFSVLFVLLTIIIKRFLIGKAAKSG